MRRSIPRYGCVLPLLLALASAVQAAPQPKDARCRQWETQLATLELSGASPRRIRILRNRIADRCVALNEMQVLGTHNSYHLQPQPALLTLLENLDSQFNAWEYSHFPLDNQFDTEKIRQVELDVYADPQGGLFARRGGLLAIGQDPNSGIAALMKPGLKVLHVQDLDFQTTCLTLVDCLKVIKHWSTRHPRHLPIMVLIEVKDDIIPDPFGFGFATPVPFGPAEFDGLDAEIRSVFPPRKLLTPDDMRRGQPTLEQAVLGLGWPTMRSIRGRIMFTLDNAGAYRDNYLAGHASLAGRVLFTDSLPGNPDAAFVEMNDPLPDTAAITSTVSAGYMVRTRADSDTVQARSGDTSMRDAAIASGAQWVSTDYPRENPAFGTGYVVGIPGGSPARCNPVTATAGCRSEAIERLP